MKPVYWVLIGISLAVALTVGGTYSGYKYGKSHAELDTAQVWLNAAEKASEIKQTQQKGVNDALRKQNEDLAAVNARQLADIERLQQRADRAELSASARTHCKGATGAELSRQDGQFLTGEAARADQLRAGLKACYAAIDTLSQ